MNIKNCFFLLTFFLVSLAKSTPTDSISYKKYFISTDFVSVDKDRNFMDSFYYGSLGIHINGGVFLRKPHVLRPFAALGMNFDRHSIAPRYFDSASKSYSQTLVNSISIQPEIGAETRPHQKWFIRLSIYAPVTLLYRAQNTSFAEWVHLYENNKLRIQNFDIRYGIQVGRSVFKQRLFLYAQLSFGSLNAFTVNTPDNSHLFSAGLGLRYHFDR